MAYNPGRVDLLGDAVKGMQLAIGLEELSSKRKTRAAEEEMGVIAEQTSDRRPMSTEIGGMNVNLGEEKVPNTMRFIEGLQKSNNPILMEKATDLKQKYATLAKTSEDTRKVALENSLQSNLNDLNILGMGLDLAKDDPVAAATFMTQHNRDSGDEKETVHQIIPMGQGKYKIIGTDSNGKPMDSVVDETQVLKARTDANTQWTQLQESKRQESRQQAERDKEKDKTAGPEYTDVTAPDTGKPGRMKTMDLVDLYRKTHPTASSDDLEFLTAKTMANLPGASEQDKASVKAMESERGNALSNYAEWAWNTYKADPLGLVHAKGPINWMGAKLPPAGLMRGKALYDQKTRKWKISDGSDWVSPNEAQQKQIDDKLGTKKK